jgi:hypothetical protein
MKPPFICAISLLCFGAGWWLDGWIGAVDEVAPEPRILATAAKGQTTSRTEEETSLPGKSTVPPANSLDDLLKLVVDGRSNLTTANLDRAVSGLDAATLAGFAAELKSRLKRQWQREEVVGAVAKRWLRLDPLPAAEFVLHYPSFLLNQNGMLNAFQFGMRKLAADDLPALRRLMTGVQDRELYIDVRLLYLDSLKGMNPAEALPLIVDFEYKTKNEIFFATNYREFPEGWIRDDPQGAMTWALALPPGRIKETLLSQLAEAWKNIDADAAKAFYHALPAEVLPAGRLKRSMARWMDGKK